jgi:hypothetical protein
MMARNNKNDDDFLCEADCDITPDHCCYGTLKTLDDDKATDEIFFTL